MLSSIHPLGEAGRRQSWPVTVAAHIVGSAIGGATAGAVLGLVGRLVRFAGVGWGWRLGLAAAIAMGAAVVDTRGWPRWLWRPHRQVNEDWLATYRGWVYGGGFGLQLGTGVATIVTAATVYVIAALAVAVGSVAGGAIIGAAFGLARGASVLSGRGIVDSETLVRFHRRLQATARWGRAVAIAADVAVAATVGIAALGLAGA